MKQLEVVKIEPKWASVSSVSSVMAYCDIGKTKTYDILRRMRESTRWRSSVQGTGKGTRIILADFEKVFLMDLNGR